MFNGNLFHFEGLPKLKRGNRDLFVTPVFPNYTLEPYRLNITIERSRDSGE